MSFELRLQFRYEGPFKTQELARTTAYEAAQSVLDIKGVKAELLDKMGWTQ